MNLLGCFVGRADMYMSDWLHLSEKGVAVYVDELSAAVNIDMGSTKDNIKYEENT